MEEVDNCSTVWNSNISVCCPFYVNSPEDGPCPGLQCYMVLEKREKTVISTICFFAGPLTFLENVLVLCLIFFTPALRRKPSYLFISSLALADVFASLFFTISFLDFHLFERTDNAEVYLFKLGGVTLSFTSSVGSLLLTALDRYICMHRPSEYKTILTRRRALACLTALWMTTIFIAFLPPLGWNCKTMDRPCSQLFPYVDHSYLACWIILVMFLLVLIIYAYIHILWKAHKHVVYMAKHSIRPGHVRMRMDIRLARMFSLILAILVTCWFPVLAFMIVDFFHCLSREQKRAFAFWSTLCLVNSSVNPLIYALRSRDMRRVMLKVLSWCRGQRSYMEGSQESDMQQKPSNQETISERVEKQI
uniref:Cannabinoid receptor 2 n=1 Tax=Lepisosteus oculatus TaxID=7918 RepID=W5NP32_LEPOC|nr:PREDICTED: cannabinoid receptor type 1A-like [Lepisosteus oculatus]XP_015204387.1 PREDICTED: cannabinoid receptor type 1A-like [Lepisosteus oculatus]